MVDINLLPEDLREKAEHEKKQLAKKPTILDFHLTEGEKPKTPQTIKKTPFLKSFFSRRKKHPVAQGSSAAQFSPLPPKDMVKGPEKKVIFGPPKVFKTPSEHVFFEKSGFIPPETETTQVVPIVEKPKERIPKPTKPAPEIEPKKVFIDHGVKRLEAEKPRGSFFAWIKSLFYKHKKKKEKDKEQGVTAPPKIFPSRRPGRPFDTLAINFIPEDLDKASEINLKKKFFTLALAVIASFLFIAFVKGILDFYKSRVGKQITQTNDRLARLQKEAGTYEDVVTQAKKLEDLLTHVEELLGEHSYWTEVFAALEKYTIPDVYFSNFAAASDGEIIMQAFGRDYTSLARQLLAFQNAKEFIDAVSIAGGQAQVNPVSKEIQHVRFTVRVKLNPEIFLIRFQKE